MAPALKIGRSLEDILYHENTLAESKLALPSAAVNALVGRDVTKVLDIERLSDRDVKRFELSKHHAKSEDSCLGQDGHRIDRWLRAWVQRSINFFIRESTYHGASDEVTKVEITEEEDIERLQLRWHSSTLRQQQPNQQQRRGLIQLQRGRSRSRG